MYRSVVVGCLVPELIEEIGKRLVSKGHVKKGVSWVVTPSTSLRLFLKRELLQVNRSWPGLRFFTLNELARWLGQELGGGVVTPARSVRARLLESILERFESERKLHVLHGLTRYKRAGTLLATSIEELKESGLEYEFLLEHMDDLATDLRYGERIRERMADLLQIWCVYEKVLDSLGWNDPPGNKRRIIEKIREFDISSFSAPEEIHFFGFYDLTGLQQDFIEALAVWVPSHVYFSARVEVQSGKVRWLKAFHFLQEVFEATFTGKTQVTEKKREGSCVYLRPRFRYAAQRYFAHIFQDESIPGSDIAPWALRKARRGPVVFRHQAQGKLHELTQSVSLIARWLAQGVEPNRIGLVGRTLDPYFPIVLDVLNHYHVPVNLVRSLPARYHPVGQWLLEAAQGFREGWKIERLFRVLKHPAVCHERLGFESRPTPWLAALEDLCKVHGIRKASSFPRFWKTLEHLNLLELPLAPNDEQERIQWWSWWGFNLTKMTFHKVRSVIDGFLDWNNKMSNASSWQEFVDLWLRFLGEWLDENALSELKWPAPPTVLSAYGPAILDAHRQDIQYLPALDKIAPADVNRERFFETVMNLIGALRVPSDEPKKSGVWLSDAMSARGLCVDYLVMLGMTDREFPRMVEEDPVLPDEVRFALRVASPWLKARRQLFEEERCLFYLLLQGIRKEVHFFHATLTDDGKPLIVSPWVLRAMEDVERCGGLTFTTRMQTHNESPVTRMDKPYHGLVHPLDLEAQPWPPRMRHRLNRLAKQLIPGPRWLAKGDAPVCIETGDVGKNPLFFEYLALQGVSPTGLWMTLQCPARAYLERILHLAPYELPQGAFLPQDNEIGTWVHAILCGLGPGLAEGVLSSLRISDVIKSSKLILELLYEEENPFWFNLVREKIESVLIEFLQHETEFLVKEKQVPYAWEKRIPRDIEVELENHFTFSVRWQGVIDRIDQIQGNGWEIVDYKWTGKPPKALSNRSIQDDYFLVKRTFQQQDRYLFQLGSYAQAWVEGEPVSSLRIAWLPSRLTSKDWYKEGLSQRIGGKEVTALVRAVSVTEARILKMVSQGKFPVNPGDECRWCRLHALCRRQDESTVRSSQEIYRKFLGPDRPGENS